MVTLVSLDLVYGHLKVTPLSLARGDTRVSVLEAKTTMVLPSGQLKTGYPPSLF